MPDSVGDTVRRQTRYHVQCHEQRLDVGIGQQLRPERARFQAISLKGKWLTEAGFTDGMPLKIRIMPGCMVITAQNTRELWHCLEGLSIEPFDPDAAANWLNHYPGGLRFTE
ncbi:SymE family type I addiction module toxin [Prodigiosinella confusarubida]|uniref:SymE family type I addiction module toxin n=1 Tax=Serratia sp. (strain ATCC 39006) TaxID=104623 RepID=UPI003A5B9541